jgi:galactonate dehydratase
MSPFDIEDLWFKLYQIEHNGVPVMYAAMAASKMAMWDLVGKACGQPVYNLVGGKVRDWVRVYANGWYHHGGDEHDLADRAQQVIARGYCALKFDPFGPGGREIGREELKRATNRSTQFDERSEMNPYILPGFHGRFSPIMALDAMRAMVPYQSHFVRGAGSGPQQRSQAQAVAAASLRAATGEHIYARFGFLDLLQR